MANFALLRGTLSKINDVAVKDGQMLLASDTSDLFFDVDTKRIRISDIIAATALPQVSDAISGKMYYVSSSNTLAYFDGSNFITINAKIVIAEGATDGTISVDGTDIPVHGLGSAAYTDSTAYDAAGSAAAVLGTEADDATKNTVYGAKKAADDAMTEAEAAAALADAKVNKVTAANGSITVGGTIVDPTIAVTISAAEDNVLTLEADGLKVSAGAAPEYSIVKAETATNGYVTTYNLTKNGTNVGAAINIPKDYLVKSASIKTAVADDPSGFAEGTKYIDFVVNTVDGDGNESHIYLNVEDLVDVYTAGDGIEISAANVVSAKVVAGNGLSVDANGVAMATATATTPGAMSATDKAKLDTVSENAQANIIEAITFNGVAVPINAETKTAAITLQWEDVDASE